MKTNTRDLIQAYLLENKQATPLQLQRHLGIGAAALFRQLKKLQGEGKIQKLGQAPKVFYLLKEENLAAPAIALTSETEKIIQQNFFYITPLGEALEGLSGFAAWCTKQGLPLQKTADEYVRTLAKYQVYKHAGLIDGMAKLRNTFETVYLDQAYYLDFYSIERFGKTKLGSLLLYAKQGQSLPLMQRVFDLVKPEINRLIVEKHIGAVGFVPPTIQRLLQFQKELERSLQLPVPIIKITKANGMVPVAQKTLNKLDDRVENARNTIFVESLPSVPTVLLIDDAMGSGATLNETARKIKEKQPGIQVIGLALTGSFKGFDVLNEV